MTESGKVLFPPFNTFKQQLALRSCSQTWIWRCVLLLFPLCQAIPQAKILYLVSLPIFKESLKMNKTFRSNSTFILLLFTCFLLLLIIISNISCNSTLVPDCLFYFLLLLHLFSNTFHHPVPFQFFFLSITFFLSLTPFPKTTALHSWFL